MAKIGLLLPNSTLYPGLSFDLVEGLKAGLVRVGEPDAVLLIEGIGFGTDADDLLAKAQKLLLQEGVDLVVGMMSRRMAEHLSPLFTAANRLLLILDVLGDFFSAGTLGPTVFFHSLQASLGSRLAGRKAVEAGAERISQAVSFYDAGYLQGYAMTQGVETNGGRMMQYVVSSHRPDQVTLQPLQAVLDGGESQAVVALYAGDLAEQFYRLYAPLASRLPLWVSPMLLEEQMLKTVVLAPDEVRGYVAWSERLETPENAVFMDELKRRGRRPTLFSLLAYEGATIIATYGQFIQARGYVVPADFERLATLNFQSPRGTIAFDPVSHFSFGPQYGATLIRDSSGDYQLSGLGAEPTVERDLHQFRTEPPPATHTGWHNTYLCI